MMKKSILLFISLFILIGFTNKSNSQDDQMKKWMDYMTPGDMQKMLAKGVGTWKMQTKWWMAPGTEPTISEATAVSEMILDGR